MHRQLILQRVFSTSVAAPIALMLLAVLVSLGAAGDQPAANQGAAADPLLEPKHAVLNAAEACLAAVDARMRANEPLSPAFVQIRSTSARHVFEAKLMLAQTPDQRIAAGQWYVDACQHFLNTLNRRAGQDVTSLQIAQQTYDVKEAELRLAEQKLAAGRR